MLKTKILYLLKRFTLLMISVITLSGCDLLSVDNPNSLVEKDLDNPAAAPALANGAEATVTRALGQILGPYSTVTDELTWIGTRDAWQQLDQGEITDPLNEFADAGFQRVGEARWTADEAIRRLENFRANGTIDDKEPLIRSYFYGAVIYISIADQFDNFVLSDRQESGEPLGEENVVNLVDTATSYLNKGLELAAGGYPDWENRLQALRARAHYSKILWAKVNPDVATSNPLVQSDAAAQDARAVLDRVDPGWSYQLETTPETDENDMAFQVNERLELRIGDAYVVSNKEGTKVDHVKLEDPIDDIPAPSLVSTVEAFTSANEYADITVISARELHLIIAEDALARNDDGGFTKAINNLRGLDGLTDYSGQLPAVELLQHERRVNLFLQGRRLADLYRFGLTSPEWVSNRVEQGAFFPITITEIRANPNVSL